MTYDDATTLSGTPVSRLAFRLSEIRGCDAPSDARVTVCPICEVPQALHVDGQAGSDATGDGTPARPFASLQRALRAAVERGEKNVSIATADT